MPKNNKKKGLIKHNSIWHKNLRTKSIMILQYQKLTLSGN